MMDKSSFLCQLPHRKENLIRKLHKLQAHLQALEPLVLSLLQIAPNPNVYNIHLLYKKSPFDFHQAINQLIHSISLAILFPACRRLGDRRSSLKYLTIILDAIIYFP